MRNVHATKGPLNSKGISDVVNQVRTNVDVDSIRMGIVFEVCSNRFSLSEEQKIIFEASGLNRSQYENAPPNSLIIKPIERGQAHFGNALVVCYPLFPLDISPVKTGEMVLFYSIVDELTSSDTGYWISRISLNNQAEDYNYAHFSRIYSDPESTNFMNGTGSDSGEILPGGEGAFNELWDVSTSAKFFKGEGVPRIINDCSGFFKAGSNRQVVCGGVSAGTSYCEISITKSSPSRLNERGIQEGVPNQRGDVYLSSSSPFAGPKVSVWEAAPSSLSSIGLLRPNSETLGSHNINFQGSCAVIAASSVLLSATETFCTKVGSSSFSIINDSAFLNSKTVLFSCEEVVFGEGNNLKFKIGGSGADQNLILGKKLQEWSEKLIDTVSDLVTGLLTMQGVIPPPTPPPATVGFSVVFPEYPAIGNQVSTKLETLKDEFAQNLSNVGFIVDSSEG